MDKILSALLVLYFIYYCIMGLAFGSGTMVVITISGLILIVVSLFFEKGSYFLLTRLIGLVLTFGLIYDDISNGFLQINVGILLYTPVMIFLLFTVWSAVMIFRKSYKERFAQE